MRVPRLVLASGSEARARLLRAAGLRFEVEPAEVDELAIREALDTDGGMLPEDVAAILAEAKAATVSERRPLDFVIGADQILEFRGRILEKAETVAEAREKLIELRGRSHRLISAVVVARTGATLWRHTDQAELRMRDFSNGFLGRYLAECGGAAIRSVGAYEIEAQGIQLFSSIAGDSFTIQGLPLLPLLQFLRQEEVIPS
jgi:septum formation protein